MGLFDRFRKNTGEVEKENKANESLEEVLNGEEAQLMAEEAIGFAQKILNEADRKNKADRDNEALKIGQARAEELKRRREQNAYKQLEQVLNSQIKQQSELPNDLREDPFRQLEDLVENASQKIERSMKLHSSHIVPSKKFNLYHEGVNSPYYIEGSAIKAFIECQLSSALSYPVDINQLNMDDFQIISKKPANIAKLVDDDKLEAKRGAFLAEMYARSSNGPFLYIGEKKYYETMQSFYEKINEKQKGKTI